MSFEHAQIQIRIGHRVSLWRDESGVDVAVGGNGEFWITDSRLRRPDVAIVRRETLDAMPPFRGSLRGCPEIAVEIISDSERVADIDKKTRLYLDNGAHAVWNIYPQSQTVVVWRKGARVAILSSGDSLEEPDLLPGLRIPLSTLFTR